MRPMPRLVCNLPNATGLCREGWQQNVLIANPLHPGWTSPRNGFASKGFGATEGPRATCPITPFLALLVGKVGFDRKNDHLLKRDWFIPFEVITIAGVDGDARSGNAPNQIKDCFVPLARESVDVFDLNYPSDVTTHVDLGEQFA